MDFREFRDLDEYSPPGHDGVVNRLLVGMADVADGAMSIWHGKFEPGGRSELHTHPTSIQVYVGLSGEFVVGNGIDERVLARNSTVIFPANSDHFIENRSDAEAEVLVVSVPGLR